MAETAPGTAPTAPLEADGGEAASGPAGTLELPADTSPLMAAAERGDNMEVQADAVEFWIKSATSSRHGQSTCCLRRHDEHDRRWYTPHPWQ